MKYHPKASKSQDRPNLVHGMVHDNEFLAIRSCDPYDNSIFRHLSELVRDCQKTYVEGGADIWSKNIFCLGNSNKKKENVWK